MASKKKRNKKYRGEDATQNPSVIKVTAPDRSAFGQWFHDNKQKVIIRTVQIVALLLIILAIYWIFG